MGLMHLSHSQFLLSFGVCVFNFYSSIVVMFSSCPACIWTPFMMITKDFLKTTFSLYYFLSFKFLVFFFSDLKSSSGFHPKENEIILLFTAQLVIRIPFSLFKLKLDLFGCEVRFAASRLVSILSFFSWPVPFQVIFCSLVSEFLSVAC